MHDLLIKFAAAVLGFGGVLTLAIKYGPGLFQKQEETLLNDILAKLNRPEDKAAFKAVLVSIKVRFPDSGSDTFKHAAAAIIAKVPALAPFQDKLIELLVAMDKAAVAGLDDVSGSGVGHS